MPDIDYEEYIVRKPVLEAGRGIKNRHSPVMTYMSRQQVPEADYYIELGWIYGMPEPNPHTYEYVYPFDEIVLYIGGDSDNPEDLGAEIEYYISGQPLTFDTTAALYVPKGVKHGPVVWKKFTRPHIEISIILGPGSSEARWSSGTSQIKETLPQKGDDIDYEKYLVRKPVYEVSGSVKFKGRQDPTMTLMSGDLVSECSTYLEVGWIWEMPEPNPHVLEHTHSYDEVVLHMGSDYNNPEDLGAELDFYLEGQPLKVDVTSAIYAPRTLKHGPLIWKWVSRPHLEMAIVFGGGTVTQSDPAGYRKE